MQFFKRVKQQTPESVELEFTLAGIGSRAYALTIDYLLLSLVILGILLLGTLFAAQIVALINQLGLLAQVELWLLAIAIVLLFAVYVGYFAVLEAISQGQTPGKKLAKIRVIRDDGRPVSFFQTAVRSLLRPIDEAFFIGFLCIVFFNKQEKRLGDLVAGTLVIQAETEDPRKTAEFAISENGKAAAKALLQVTDFSSLLPDDFATVREYLRRRPHMNAEGIKALSRRLGEEIQAILQLEQLPYDMPADTFLEGVYVGYQASQDPLEANPETNP